MYRIGIIYIGVLFVTALAVATQSAESSGWENNNVVLERVNKMMISTESNEINKWMNELHSMIEKHEDNVLVLNVVNKILNQINLRKDPFVIIETIKDARKEIQEILAFQVTQEDSDLAAGFPEPGPLGKIQIQEYPKYRMAFTPNGWFEFSTFYRLFNHIRDNNISMTVPVEMKYDEDRNDLDSIDMGFIYANTEIGKLQHDGKVEVRDFPATTVVCVGLNGDRDDKKIKRTADQLKKWLKEKHPDYRISGKLRVYAYNSPMVSKSKNYFEVQYPIQKINEN